MSDEHPGAPGSGGPAGERVLTVADGGPGGDRSPGPPPSSSSEPPDPAGPTQGRSRLPLPLLHRFRERCWFWPVVAYLAARILTLVGVVVVDRFTHKGIHHVLGVWDGAWFVRAAVHGWPAHLPLVDGHVARNTIAFFPAFPLVIRALSGVTPLSPLAAGLVISGITGLTAVVSVALLVRHYAGEDAARRGALLFALCPGTFVFSLAYSEGITITCLALGLLALLKRRWWWAGALGLVATATSPIALAFVVSCAWCAVRAIVRERDWRSLAAPVLAPLGFAAYMVWLWVHTGTLSAWRLTERGGWQSYPSPAYPVHILTTFLFDPVAPTETGQILFAGTVVTVIGAVLAIRQRQPAPVLTYGLLAAALAAVAAPVGLRPRFVMLAFPLVVAVGTRLHGRAYRWVVALSACLLVAMTALELASSAVFP